MSKPKSKTPPKELPRPSLRTRLLGGVCAKALDAGMGMHNQIVERAARPERFAERYGHGKRR